MSTISPLYKLKQVLETGDLSGYDDIFREDCIINWGNTTETVIQARESTNTYDLPVGEISFTPDYRTDITNGYVEVGDLLAQYSSGRVFAGRYCATIEDGQIVNLFIKDTRGPIDGKIVAVKNNIEEGGIEVYKIDIVGKKTPHPLRFTIPAAKLKKKPEVGDRIEVGSFIVRGGPGRHQHNIVEAIHMNFV